MGEELEWRARQRVQFSVLTRAGRFLNLGFTTFCSWASTWCCRIPPGFFASLLMLFVWIFNIRHSWGASEWWTHQWAHSSTHMKRFLVSKFGFVTCYYVWGFDIVLEDSIRCLCFNVDFLVWIFISRHPRGNLKWWAHRWAQSSRTWKDICFQILWSSPLFFGVWHGFVEFHPVSLLPGLLFLGFLECSQFS